MMRYSYVPARRKYLDDLSIIPGKACYYDPSKEEVVLGSFKGKVHLQAFEAGGPPMILQGEGTITILGSWLVGRLAG